MLGPLDHLEVRVTLGLLALKVPQVIEDPAAMWVTRVKGDLLATPDPKDSKDQPDSLVLRGSRAPKESWVTLEHLDYRARLDSQARQG